MRISQLSQRAGLPVGTVKFYLRTGLLHHGEATSATQAIYDEDHLHRLRLIRALLEVAHLSHAQIQRVLDASALPGTEEGVTQALQATAPTETGEVDTATTQSLLEDLGWQVDDDSPYLQHLARALEAVDSVRLPMSTERLRTYADAAAHVARHDAQVVSETDESERAFVAATGAVLFDEVLGALRGLATEHQAARRTSPVPAPRLSVGG